MDPVATTSHPLPMVKGRRPIPRAITSARVGLPISEWLDFLGKTQTWLADETGYSETYISLLASGKKRYNQDILERFAEAMGIEPSMLLHKPTEEDFWALWRSLTADQRRRAQTVIRALKETD